MRRAGTILGLGLALASALMPAGAAEDVDESRPLKPAFAVEGIQPVAVELITEHASIRPGGTTRVGVFFDLAEGWHIYASDPGDAGLPTDALLSGPPGVEFGPLHWPLPEDFHERGGITTHGYSGSVMLFATLTYAASSDADQLPLTAQVTWLACKEVCVPGEATRQLSLPVSHNEPVLSTHGWLFDQVP